MKPLTMLGGIFLSVSLVLEQGCWWKREPRKATIVIPPAPQPGPPAQLPPPPSLPASSSVPTIKGNPDLPSLPAPAGAEQPKRPRATKKSAATVPAGNPTGPVPSATASIEPVADPTLGPPNPNAQASPSLQPILATQEVLDRSKRIQEYLDRARVTVLRAERNKPDQKSKELIAQVRTFIQQAEESKKNDLVRAENLAERAEVLSRGLK